MNRVVRLAPGGRGDRALQEAPVARHCYGSQRCATETSLQEDLVPQGVPVVQEGLLARYGS